MISVHTLLGIADRLGFDVSWAEGYAEPGYTDSDVGVVFANWNNVTRYDRDTGERTTVDATPERMLRMFEAAGAEVEWSDEWSTCCDCGKAVRTSPDSYCWTQSFSILNDCELVCSDCIQADPQSLIDELSDNPHSADTMGIVSGLDGWHEVSADNETGFHPGQDDKPADVLKALHAHGLSGIVFSVDSVGQFDAHWSAWAHEDNIPDRYWDKHLASV